MADASILAAGRALFGNFTETTPTNYVYLYGGNGTHIVSDRTPTQDIGLGIDCSHLVQQSLLAAGYNVPFISTTSFLTNGTSGTLTTNAAQYYNLVPLNTLQAGDVVLFNGHMGIVADYDASNGTGHFYGSQTSTGPATTGFSTNGSSGFVAVAGLAPRGCNRCDWRSQ
jgi:hypothetical protein